MTEYYTATAQRGASFTKYLMIRVIIVVVIVRPRSTVGYTSVASVTHCRPWSNYLNSM